MKFVNLFTGKKTLIEENYKSFKNLQFNNYEQNYNFTMNRCLPTNLIAKKSLLIRFIYYFVDFFERVKFFLKNLN